jgi:hypothetical protein
VRLKHVEKISGLSQTLRRDMHEERSSTAHQEKEKGQGSDLRVSGRERDVYSRPASPSLSSSVGISKGGDPDHTQGVAGTHRVAEKEDDSTETEGLAKRNVFNSSLRLTARLLRKQAGQVREDREGTDGRRSGMEFVFHLEGFFLCFGNSSTFLCSAGYGV